MDKNWVKQKEKINRGDIAGGLHITFCIKVRFNLALITIPQDDSLEPLSLVNPGKKRSLTETKGFRLFFLLVALFFWLQTILFIAPHASLFITVNKNEKKTFRIITKNFISCLRGYQCTFILWTILFIKTDECCSLKWAMLYAFHAIRLRNLKF